VATKYDIFDSREFKDGQKISIKRTKPGYPPGFADYSSRETLLERGLRVVNIIT